MAEFVAENPGIFEELGRFFKTQAREKAESSKRRLAKSPEIPSEKESDDRHPVRSSSKCVSSRSISKIPGRHPAEEPWRREGKVVDYMRALPFTDDINGKMILPNFKLTILQSYDGRDNPENHFHAFIFAFRLYCVPDFIICRIFLVFL